ncbi:MAG: hypothetical protein C4539_14520 [Ignavibacteriales bacterium]|nr:MAG: hypothetical protein C4539_14520 [Ignavibacteriales bacterium]
MVTIIKSSSIYNNGEFEMTQKKFEEVEELVMLKGGRVKQDGQKAATFCEAGSKVKVAGVDKVQLLSSKMADYPKAKAKAE